MSGRSPDDVLRELGGTLEAGWSARSRRSLWRRLLPGRRGAVVAAVAGLVLVPTAVATRDAIWAPEPPAIPGAREAARPGSAVFVATGEDPAPWKLSAALCRYGGAGVVGVFLTVPGGGAGARCDDAAASAALGGPRVHTYFDPVAGVTWAFGALPGSARTVRVGGRTVSAVEADPRAVGKAGLPDGLRVFVVALPGAADAAVVEARDAAGAVVLRCRDGRCAR